MQVLNLRDKISVTEFSSESLSECLRRAASTVDNMDEDTYAHSITTEFDDDGWKVILFWGTNVL